MARDHIRFAGITPDRQQIDSIDCIEIDRAELIEEGVRRREHPAEREELIRAGSGGNGSDCPRGADSSRGLETRLSRSRQSRGLSQKNGTSDAVVALCCGSDEAAFVMMVSAPFL